MSVKPGKPENKSSNKHLNEDAAAYYQQVATNMKKARTELNLTQQQIADAMEIPRSTYKSLESGEVGIYCYHMAKWSYATGFDVRRLTMGSKYDLTINNSENELTTLITSLPQNQHDAVIKLLKSM